MRSPGERFEAFTFGGIEGEGLWGFSVKAGHSPGGEVHRVLDYADVSAARQACGIFLQAEQSYPFLDQAAWRACGAPQQIVHRDDGVLDLVEVENHIDGAKRLALRCAKGRPRPRLSALRSALRALVAAPRTLHRADEWLGKLRSGAV